MGWKLIGIGEPVDGQTIIVDRDMVIGRHQQTDIILQASHVSRRHAALLLKEDGRQLWIQDLESSNGTFVNGEKVVEQQLKNLDEINFENIRFQIVAEIDQGEKQSSISELEKVVPSDEGMRTLEERSTDVEVNRDGMPTNIGVPKPAPIPDHIDVTASIKTPVIDPSNSVSENRVQKVEQEQKNAKVGVISVVVFVILLILAGIIFMGQ